MSACEAGPPPDRPGREAALPNKKVLIVVGSYEPAMIADMHRARHLAWHLPEFGWDVEILAPDASYQERVCLDPDSRAFFSAAKVHWVGRFAPSLFKLMKARSIGVRSLAPMWRAGSDVLRRGAFDVVYFSTTQFPLFLLGPIWRRRFGIPYVLDFQDPLFREGRQHDLRLHRGLKHTLARGLFRRLERASVLSASGLVSVSPVYLDTLQERYGALRPAWSRPTRRLVSPFAVSLRDVDVVRDAKRPRSDESDQVRIVYVGAGGPIMQRSFGVFCRALSALRQSGAPGADRVSIELYGTNRHWREGDPAHLAQTAVTFGVGDLVNESPRWVSYRTSLALTDGADASLVLGVDDAGYMPSKLFTALSTGKPLLAIVRKDGPAFAAMARTSALVHALWFTERDEMPLAESVRIVGRFLAEAGLRASVDRRAELAPYSARQMASRHAALFDEVSGRAAQTGCEHPAALVQG